MPSEDIFTRRYLPHWYQPGHAHFITFRLADSIPNQLLREWRAEREVLIRQASGLPPELQAERRLEAHREFFKKYDHFLDRNDDARWLADSRVASIVRENLYHHRGTKYELLAFCVMPNHVHVVLQPFEGVALVGQAASLPVHTAEEATQVPTASSHERDSICVSDEILDSHSPLATIMHSLKSDTANKANEVLGRQGQFWQHESYDHWVRDVDELERIVKYIRVNPVRAGLCEAPEVWTFSSAADRFRQDGSACALVGWLRDDWRRGASC